jgi:hypothetical protein
MRAGYTMVLPDVARGETLGGTSAKGCTMIYRPHWLCLLALAGCSGKPPAPQTAATPAGTAQAASVATPWDSMKQDEQRAKDVQNIVNQQAARQDKQIEKQAQ